MLQKQFQYNFNKLIWKIQNNFANKSIVLEIRDIKEKTCQFYILNLENNTLEEINLNSNNWWISLLCTNENYNLFQLQNQNNPLESNLLICYSNLTKKVIWNKENSILTKYNNLNINIQNIFTQNKETLNWHDGQILKSNIEIESNVDENIFYPDFYKNDQMYYTDIADFILQKENKIAVDAIEYLEYKELILISYYICNLEKKLDNYLLIINSKGDLVLSETLGKNLPGIGNGTFYISNDKLIFIRDNSEINIFEIIDPK